MLLGGAQIVVLDTLTFHYHAVLPDGVLPQTAVCHTLTAIGGEGDDGSVVGAVTSGGAGARQATAVHSMAGSEQVRRFVMFGGYVLCWCAGVLSLVASTCSALRSRLNGTAALVTAYWPEQVSVWHPNGSG